MITTNGFYKKCVTMVVTCFVMYSAAIAQEEPKLTIKPSERILFDAAYMDQQHRHDEDR